MTNIKNSKHQQDGLGECLVDAGLLTSNQLKTALDEHKLSGRPLQEILIMREWIKPQTLNFFKENLVYPNLLISEKRQLFTNSQFLINLSPKKVLKLLIWVIIGFLTLALIGQFSVHFLPDFPSRYFLFEDQFNLDKEGNIPTLYSALTLLFCSFLLFIISDAKKLAQEAHIIYWRALSIIFLVLSLDELLSFHEHLITPLRKIFSSSNSDFLSSRFFYFAWVIPGAIFVLIFTLGFLRFIIALPKRTQHLFILAGAIYISGCLGMEILNGYYATTYGYENIIYGLLTTIEEFLEMLGIVIFIYALLSYISTYMKGLSLKMRININN